MTRERLKRSREVGRKGEREFICNYASCTPSPAGPGGLGSTFLTDCHATIQDTCMSECGCVQDLCQQDIYVWGGGGMETKLYGSIQNGLE